MFLHNEEPIFFNIRGWAFIRGSILGKFAWKIGIFGIQIGEWASNRDFTVLLLCSLLHTLLKDKGLCLQDQWKL